MGSFGFGQGFFGEYAMGGGTPFTPTLPHVCDTLAVPINLVDYQVASLSHRHSVTPLAKSHTVEECPDE
jgi:hypothetical protein